VYYNSLYTAMPEKKRKTTKAVKPLPTSIKEKETHWPEEP